MGSSLVEFASQFFTCCFVKKVGEQGMLGHCLVKLLCMVPRLGAGQLIQKHVTVQVSKLPVVSNLEDCASFVGLIGCFARLDYIFVR